MLAPVSLAVWLLRGSCLENTVSFAYSAPQMSLLTDHFLSSPSSCFLGCGGRSWDRPGKLPGILGQNSDARSGSRVWLWLCDLGQVT